MEAKPRWSNQMQGTHTDTCTGWQKGQSKAARICFDLAMPRGLVCVTFVFGPWLLDSEQGGWHNRPVIGICIELLFIAPRSRLRSSQNREIIGNNFACWIDWFAFLGPKPKLQSLFVSVNSDGMCLDCCILILLVVDTCQIEIPHREWYFNSFKI